MEAFGAWTLESLIAVGGLGEVWRANIPGTPAAALKRIHTHLARNEEILGQFALEQQLVTALPRHPNVIGAYAAGDVDGRLFLAMQLAPGEDLRRILAKAAEAKRPTALARTRTIRIVAQACDAVAHLHAHGYAHGDINPGNLVLDEASDHVTLVDLGVARRLDSAPGAVRGTHAYMAPEQVRGETWTTATDVFALGVVLWELASGVRLFHRGPSWLSLAAVVEAPVPPLDDRELDAIAQAALHKDPAQRLSSARELAARLSDLITS
ncbi:MAG: serine/threonine-protein kinase [Kofleriaceae bacterium]|nr:serine/threonine-protein kinase [Kofleriaceae bacterium]